MRACSCHAAVSSAQGFEGDVLEGERNVLLHRKIPHILTEVGPGMLRAANSDATTFLQQFVEARPRPCSYDMWK